MNISPRAAAVLFAVMPMLFAMMSIAGIGFILAAPAAAHDELVRSSPRDGAVLATLPGVVTLVFEEPPADGFTTMSVTGPSGARVNTTGPQTSGATITEPVAGDGRPGSYVITYRIMSDDGHPVSGTIGFIVRLRGRTTTATTAKKPEAAATSPSPTLGAIAGVTVFGVLAVAALRFRRPRG